MAEKVKMIEPEKLIPYEKNARRNNNAVDAVAESIARFGFLKPIIVDAKMVIISGHTRRLAALKLGLEKVPVQIAEDMTEEQAKAFRLADNRIAEIAEWDEEKLQEEIKSISDEIDVSIWGFDTDMLQKAIDEKVKCKCPRCGQEWEE